jgi:hypothetical protein
MKYWAAIFFGKVKHLKDVMLTGWLHSHACADGGGHGI